MNRDRLEHAARLYRQLEQQGVSDAQHPHAGDRLITWGELPKDLPEGVRALDLRSWLVLDPDFAAEGLSTPWANSELSLGITHLATFFEITESEAFFIFGPLQTPVFTHAVERVQAVLKGHDRDALATMSAVQHDQLGCDTGLSRAA